MQEGGCSCMRRKQRCMHCARAACRFDDRGHFQNTEQPEMLAVLQEKIRQLQQAGGGSGG